jgi:hypothetical protein
MAATTRVAPGDRNPLSATVNSRFAALQHRE